MNTARIAQEVVRQERAGNFRAALEAQQRLLEHTPRGARALNKLGDLHARLGQTSGAVEAWGRSARQFEGEGFVHNAAAVWKKAVRAAPGDLGLLRGLADAHAALGHSVEARDVYDALAREAVARGERRLAAEALERAVDLAPEPGLRARLGELHAHAGRPDDAAAHALAATEEWLREGATGEARALLDTLLALYPAHPRLRAGLADALLAEGAVEAALRVLEELARDSPEPSHLKRLAECRLAAGRGEAARAAFTALVEAAPDDVESRIGLVRCELLHGSVGAAFDNLSPVLDPLLERGDRFRVASLLLELLQRDPEHVPALVQLARVYGVLGDHAALAATYARLAEAHARRGEAGLERAAGDLAQALGRRGPGPGAQAGAHAAPPVADLEAALDAAVRELRSATALMLVAGAGMEVEYGAVDWADPQALWRALPAYRAGGLRFEDLARAGLFESDATLGWGFWGQRLARSRAAEPHEGLWRLSRWRARAPGGGFVVTSSVEGAFEAAGFDPLRMVECRGSLRWLQCSRECGAEAVAAEPIEVPVDAASGRAVGPLPACPACGAVARPNVLMLGDAGWDMARVSGQDERLHTWLERAGPAKGMRLVVVECGETPRLPMLRPYVRRLTRGLDACTIRLSASDWSVPEGGLGIPLGAREAIDRIDERLRA